MILDVLFLGDDDEDDPLDAYMKNLENQAKTKGIYLFYVLYKIISRFLHELLNSFQLRIKHHCFGFWMFIPDSGSRKVIVLFIYRRPTLYPVEIAVDFLKSL